jgi:hypothetical protein
MPTRRVAMNPRVQAGTQIDSLVLRGAPCPPPTRPASHDGPADNTGHMASSAGSPRAVRIATLNTWGTRGNWTERRRVLSDDGLLALDADLLTLQETIVDDGYDQAADVLDSRYEIIHQQDRETDGQGNQHRQPMARRRDHRTGHQRHQPHRRLRLRQPHH